MPHNDEILQQNLPIERAIQQLQSTPTQEELAHTLTVLRRRMQAGGQWIAAVEPVPGTTNMQPKTVATSDGARWWYAFTSFEEELKSPDAVKSAFRVDMRQLFRAALDTPDVAGIILNPWHCTLQLDKTLIRIILAEM